MSRHRIAHECSVAIATVQSELDRRTKALASPATFVAGTDRARGDLRCRSCAELRCGDRGHPPASPRGRFGGGRHVDVDDVGDVGRVAARERDAHWDAVGAEGVEDELVAAAETVLGEGKSAQPITLPGIGAR